MIAADQKMPRSFLWMNAAQFGGALNDNVYRLLVVLFLISLSGVEAASRVSGLVGIVFVLPFLVFTPIAGVLADRYSKRQISIGVKMAECVCMSLALIAFWLMQPVLAYVVVFFMSVQSAIFGPSKYGIVPELVGTERLSRANGFLILFTYLAIILGSAAAPTLDQLTESNYVLAGAACVTIAFLGLGAMLRVERTPEMNTQHQVKPVFVREIVRTLSSIRNDRLLFLVVWSAAYFLFLGGFVQMNIIPYGIDRFDLAQQQSAYLFLPAALGIGLGAWFVGRISANRIELGWVPLGVMGVIVGCLVLAIGPPTPLLVAVVMALLGFSAGLFIVPLEAFIQYRSPSRRRGEIIAAKAFLAWCGVLLASLLMLVFDAIRISPAQGFLFIGAGTLLLVVLGFRSQSDIFRDTLVTTVSKATLRIRAHGDEYVPTPGSGVLLVGNQLSWIEILGLQAVLQRRIRFLCPHHFFERHPARALLRLAGAIPVHWSESASQVQSLDRMQAALADGEAVYVPVDLLIGEPGFAAELKGTLNGLLPSEDAVEVVPFYGSGEWGTLRSALRCKKGLSRWRIMPYPVAVHFGAPLEESSPSLVDVQAAIRVRSIEYFEERKTQRGTLPQAFFDSARQNWCRTAISDTTGKQLIYGKTLTATLILADLIRDETRDQRFVGVLLPPSVGAVIANLAVSLLGKVPVNLSYVASNEFRDYCLKECDISTVLTSRKLVEKLDALEAPSGSTYLEDLLGGVTTGRRLKTLLKARFGRRAVLLGDTESDPDQVATIMFSSGSTGTPKGVMLSHHNILSNVEAFRLVYQPEPDERICAVLPFFHSFGYTATFWFPLLSGIGAAYHTNPTETKQITRVVRDNKCTLLLATPTFLLGYMRKIDVEDFKSLRYVVAGAEKLKASLADAFESKFGIRPLEGYGATECSPVISVNLPSTAIDGSHVDTSREGTVGQPLPGVAIRLVHPESLDPLPLASEGLLLVRGANVMQGYWRNEDETRKAMRDGWYVTGDIVEVDEQGFIRIKDRLARFSKIGGEMVPHIAVEEVLYAGLGTYEQVLSVTSAPNPKRGEQLVVLYKKEAGDAEKLHEIVQNSALPLLWRPHRKAYHVVDNLPVLGSGKLDVRALRALAEDRADRA